jgi:hypothetical protein
MSAPTAPPWYRGLGSSVALGGLLLYVGSFARPEWVALLAAAAGVAGGSYLRWDPSPLARSAAPAPPLAALSVVALLAPRTFLVAGLAAVGSVLFLAWLADDPRRAPGGAGRAVPTLLTASLLVALAWGSSSLVPAGTATLGVAAGLVILVVVAVALLVARPELMGGEEAPAS